MEILATFPTVRIDTSQAIAAPPAASVVRSGDEPEPARRPSRGVARPRRAGPRVPPRSVTVLTIVALATWAAVWWIERGRLGERGATVAHAGAVSGEELLR